LKVELSGSDKPGNLFAEFFNSAPLFLYKLEHFAQLFHIAWDRPQLVELAASGFLDQPGDFFCVILQQAFGELRQIDGITPFGRNSYGHARSAHPDLPLLRK
jgi:hypothetical protein